MEHLKTITVGELREKLSELLAQPARTELYFGNGDLSLHRVRDRRGANGQALWQIEFNEVYSAPVDPKDA